MVTLFSQKNCTLIPLIWLFIYSAIIPMQLSNYVLCIGEDGHIEFEFAANGCCTDVPAYDLDHPEEAAAKNEDHCGECVDFPIFASLNSELYIVSAQENLPIQDTVSVTLPISQEISNYSIPTSTLFSVIPPLINPTLISLRTVTLLI